MVDAIPYYFGWVMTSIFMIERTYGKACVSTMALSLGIFEIFTKMYISYKPYDQMLASLFVVFPETYTTAENLKLIRQVFPIVLQLLVLFLDNTLDR